MCLCAHTRTCRWFFTSTLNKITHKIDQKHRTPSEKKKFGTSKVFQRLYVFHLYAQRNHSLNTTIPLTLAARGLEEPCASFPDFCNNHQFHVIYCVSSRLCTLFRRISDSRFTWIHDFEENLTESVGPVPFSAQYLICRHVRTDELIRVGLGNLRFLQVYLGTLSSSSTITLRH